MSSSNKDSIYNIKSIFDSYILENTIMPLIGECLATTEKLHKESCFEARLIITPPRTKKEILIFSSINIGKHSKVYRSPIRQTLIQEYKKFPQYSPFVFHTHPPLSKKSEELQLDSPSADDISQDIEDYEHFYRASLFDSYRIKNGVGEELLAKLKSKEKKIKLLEEESKKISESYRISKPAKGEKRTHPIYALTWKISSERTILFYQFLTNPKDINLKSYKKDAYQGFEKLAADGIVRSKTLKHPSEWNLKSLERVISEFT